MTSSSDYLDRNREFWTRFGAEHADSCRKAWRQEEITWGLWSIPEAEVGAFGDLPAQTGADVIELGCGTAYFSSWLARRGLKPVGVDLTPSQLDIARAMQVETGIEFPLIEGNAEEVPLPDASFDIALSEYGASIWCHPSRWITEASRLLRPGGVLIFLRNTTISTVCMPNEGQITTSLHRDWFGMNRLEWSDDESVEFHLPTGEMLRLLRANGFEVEDLIELQAPESAGESEYYYVTPEWARRWPSEEIWRARKTR